MSWNASPPLRPFPPEPSAALNEPDPPPEPPAEPRNGAVRTTFAVALQLGRVLARLVALMCAAAIGDRAQVRRLAASIATAILRGARDRGRGRYVRSLVDQQRRRESLTRLRPSRPGRGPQAVAARRRAREDKVNA
jgi:hypothetical protein